MNKWKTEFIHQIKSGVSPAKAAPSAAGLPIEAVTAMRLSDPEFNTAWSDVENMQIVPLNEGTLMPMLPDTDDIKELCRSVSVETTKRLIDIALNSESETNALKAISEINDRGWGKSAQAIQHSGDIDLGLAKILDSAIRRRSEQNK